MATVVSANYLRSSGCIVENPRLLFALHNGSTYGDFSLHSVAEAREIISYLLHRDKGVPWHQAEEKARVENTAMAVTFQPTGKYCVIRYNDSDEDIQAALNAIAQKA